MYSREIQLSKSLNCSTVELRVPLDPLDCSQPVGYKKQRLRLRLSLACNAFKYFLKQYF